MTKPREKFTLAAMQGLVERVDRYGFAGCKLTLSVYFDQPRRIYRDVPGQSIRMRVFSLKTLNELLQKIDDATVEVGG